MKEPLINVVIFFIFGTFNNFGYFLMLAAAEDILNGAAPAGVVLLCDVLPAVIVSAISPFFAHKLTFAIKFLIVLTLTVAAFVLATFSDVSVVTALIGVCLNAASNGFGEQSFLSYCSRFSKPCVSSWSSGSGFAGIFGAGVYAILTKILNQNPKTILYSFIGFPFFMYEAYLASCPTQLDADEESQLNETISQIDSKTKLQSLWGVKISLCSLVIVYIAEYTINQGVAPAIDFPNTKFEGMYYEFAEFAYCIGVFFSRSSLPFFTVKEKYIPIPAFLQVCFLVLFSLEARFHFIGNFYVMLGLTFVEGLFGGLVYVAAMYQISSESEWQFKQFRLSVASLSCSFGILLASLLAMVVETELKKEV